MLSDATRYLFSQGTKALENIPPPQLKIHFYSTFGEQRIKLAISGERAWYHAQCTEILQNGDGCGMVPTGSLM